MVVKTAISLEEPLFNEADSVAQELNISRSRLFAVAVEEFLERYKTKKLVDGMNRVHATEPEEDERRALRGIREQMRRQAQGQW
jgi:metal-responsive CopG/Arc/MetJ family transcriptional regulator